MSAFRDLYQSCRTFERELQKNNAEGTSAKYITDITEEIDKKLKILNVYSLKQKLLHAKKTSESPQVKDSDQSTVYQDYTSTVESRVIESAIVKSMTQSSAVKKLLTTPDLQLDPELVERKQTIINTYKSLVAAEAELRFMDEDVVNSEDELFKTMREWDVELAEMRAKLAAVDPVYTERQRSGLIYEKMSALVKKMELMRQLISKLVISTSCYDWLSDPADLMSALEYTRREYTVDMFLEYSGQGSRANTPLQFRRLGYVKSICPDIIPWFSRWELKRTRMDLFYEWNNIW